MPVLFFLTTVYAAEHISSQCFASTDENQGGAPLTSYWPARFPGTVCFGCGVMSLFPLSYLVMSGLTEQL